MGRPEHRQLTATYHHKPGRCVVHLGRKRHGADNIASGERNNLIIWCTNDVFRQCDEYRNHSLYQQESGAPDLQCLSFTHDIDIEKYTEYPANMAHLKNSGWCPPIGKAHDFEEPPAYNSC